MALYCRLRSNNKPSACQSRIDRRFSIWALDKDEFHEFDLKEVGRKQTGSWRDYAEGMIRTLAESVEIGSGANIVFSSTVPIGAGMSSSAALETVIGYALLALTGRSIDRLALAKAGQEAEHNYAGTRAGIMDQFTSVFGRSGNAILLDCRDLSSKYFKLSHTEFALVVCNSRVQHELASGEYNRRRQECEDAVAALRAVKSGVTHLRDISTDDLGLFSDLLSPIQLKRARHVIGENDRTLQAADHLASGNIEAVGKLMLESHRSLRDYLEVSCSELDLLVDLAQRVDGVVGARMMGGGFGGSTINLMSDDSVGSFRERVATEYVQAFGVTPEFYEVRSSDGASEIT